MTKAEAMQLVAVLKAGYPRQPIDPDTVQAYATFLEDLDPTEATVAVKRIITSSRFFPTISEIREAVAEQACALPGEVAAWETVSRYAFWRPAWGDCPACAGTPDPDRACPTCRDEGRIVTNPRQPLDPALARALEYVGGAAAVVNADNPAVVRAQFRDAYRQIRAETVRAKMTPAGLAPASPTHRLGTHPAALPAATLRDIDA